ncbi:MAG: hypothetical protein DHS20C21_02130 [Gemmatimonadota bacterium]|nr:MAG: hypothetical protein DHS20C21_02130 [Gemmatimonadota bacterium]
MNSRTTRLAMTIVLAASAFALGCDPKLTGTEGDGGTGTPTQVTVVTPEALIVGNIVAFHTDLFAAALSVSADYDSSSALRAFETDCVSLEPVVTARASTARYELLFDGCVDSHGTTYRGGGQLLVVNDQDGYTFLPLFDTNLIRATNESNDDYNHDLTAGSFEFAFQRDGSDNIVGIRVDKFLRHGVRGDVVTFSYGDVTYSGGIGEHGEYPDNGSVARVVWDGVGLFDVNYSGGPTASYSFGGGSYSVNLSTGDVSIVEI